MSFRTWLEDPVRVLATMNRTAAYACLFFAAELGGFPGLLIGCVGGWILLEMRRIERS